jgi:spore coat protein U-like protein
VAPSPVHVNVVLGELPSGTIFHYRLVASNSVGAHQGGDETFMTPNPSFNGDDLADLVVCSNNDEYAVALSGGAVFGAPGSGVWSNWACNPHALVGDFTGDGVDGIAVPNEASNTWAVSVSGGSSFGAAGTGTWLTGWTWKPTWAAVGDFTGDGKDDLIMCNNNEYSVALSNGKEFGAPGSGVWSKWACNPHAVVGDFNGDGKDDIAVPNEANNTWAVDLSTGAGFEAVGSGTWLAGWTAKPTWAAAGDFTGNGKDDLILCNNNDEYSVALSNGKELGAPGSSVWSKWACNQHAVVGDFNGDAKEDIAVPNEANNTWSVSLSNGAEFGAPGTNTWLTSYTTKPAWAGVGG